MHSTALWNEPRTGLFIVCRFLPFAHARDVWEALKRVLLSILLPLAALLTASMRRTDPRLFHWNKRREIAEKSHAAVNTRDAKVFESFISSGNQGARRKRIESTPRDKMEIKGEKWKLSIYVFFPFFGRNMRILQFLARVEIQTRPSICRKPAEGRDEDGLCATETALTSHLVPPGPAI